MHHAARRASWALFTLTVLAGQASAQLRVVAWNISNYGGTNRAADIQTAVYGSFNGRQMAPDVIAAQEFTSASALSTFVSVLNTAPGSPGDWAAAPFITGPDTQSVLVYRTSKVTLLGARTIALGGADPDQPRNTYRYDLRPVGYSSVASTFAIYNVHMKAGSTSSDNSRRLVESQAIRDNAEGVNTNGAGSGLPAGYHFMVAGDMNMQSATQSSYVEFVGSQANNAGRFFDPINTPGSWNNNDAYRFVHSQDPSGAGGMDDRHDQILISAGLRDGSGLDYIGSSVLAYSTTTWNDPNHSYRVWGNDGSSFDAALTTTGNAMVGPTIAQALRNCADTTGGHLPVYLDMRVPAEVTSPITVNFGAVSQGSTAQQSITVSNAGDVAKWTLNGIDGLSYSLVASPGFTITSGGPFTDAAGGGGNSHTITMLTSTVGAKNGTLVINSNSPDEPQRIITLTGSVVAPNQPPVAGAGPDQTLTDSDNSGGEPVTLASVGSSDSDGTIIGYRWSEGPTILATGTPANIVLPVGVHTITLRVEDDDGAFGFDDVVITVNPGSACGSADFDGDGDSGTDSDIEAFFACLGGDCCGTCGSADFDADGDSGTDADIEAFFRVLGGGTC